MKDGAHRHDQKDKYGLHGHEQYEGRKGLEGSIIESKSTTKKVGNKTITTRITKIIHRIRQKKRTRKTRKPRHR